MAKKQSDLSDKTPCHLKQSLTMASLFLWFLVFFSQAHKEERFMYPIYSLLCLTAACTLYNVQQIVWNLWRGCTKMVNLLIGTSLLLFVLLSLARIVALYQGNVKTRQRLRHLKPLVPNQDIAPPFESTTNFMTCKDTILKMEKLFCVWPKNGIDFHQVFSFQTRSEWNLFRLNFVDSCQSTLKVQATIQLELYRVT